jgi:hypothetical protein
MENKNGPTAKGSTPDGENSQGPITSPEKPAKKLLKKTLAAFKMVDAGISPREAIETVNLKSHMTDAAVSRFADKYKKYGLNNEETAHLASRQIKRILRARAREEAHTKVTKDGQVIDYTDNIYPTDSNIIAAAAMVYDRYEPIKSADPGQGAGNTYIDLSTYQIAVNVDKPVDRSSCQPIDGTIEAKS